MMPSGAALAQDYEELPQTLERNVYMQLSGIMAIETFEPTEVLSGVFADLGRNSGGLAVRIGFRTSAWFAIETQFEWARGMHPDGDPSGDDWTTTFNARVYPLSDLLMEGGVQPYLLVGTGASSFKRLQSCFPADVVDLSSCRQERVFGFSSRWGGGLDFHITDRIVATADASYVWTTGTPIKDLDYVSVGVGAMYKWY
jgi:opacity protein-like surface antigen